MSFGQLCDVEKLCPEVGKIFFFGVAQNCHYYKPTLSRQFGKLLHLSVKLIVGITALLLVRSFGCAPL